MNSVTIQPVIHRFLVVARRCHGDLADGPALSTLAQHTAARNGLTVVGMTVHTFIPHGLSVALLLAQSHLVLATWPEHRTATVDIVACTDVATPRAVWRDIEHHLQPESSEIDEQEIALE